MLIPPTNLTLDLCCNLGTACLAQNTSQKPCRRWWLFWPAFWVHNRDENCSHLSAASPVPTLSVSMEHLLPTKSCPHEWRKFVLLQSKQLFSRLSAHQQYASVRFTALYFLFPFCCVWFRNFRFPSQVTGLHVTWQARKKTCCIIRSQSHQAYHKPKSISCRR